MWAKDRLAAISAAGLMVTPELLECAEACVRIAEGKICEPYWWEPFRRAWRAGRAHAATLAKPERYEVPNKELALLDRRVRDTSTGLWLSAEDLLALLNGRTP